MTYQRIAWLTGIGTFLEWAEFVFFAYIAGILGMLYFPSENPTTARLKLLYIFIVTILCMKEAYRTGGVVFSSWICSVGVMLMILLACSFLGIVSDFKKCMKKKLVGFRPIPITYWKEI